MSFASEYRDERESIGEQVESRPISKINAEQLDLSSSDLKRFDIASRKEWLLTNGIGGFASSTVSGANTRRYHGLLLASLRPPVERVAMISKFEEEVHYQYDTFHLSANEYGDGTVNPSGYIHTMTFSLKRGLPVWRFAVKDALLEKTVLMARGENTTYVRYSLLRASAPLTFFVRPLCTYRDYHSQHRGELHYDLSSDKSICSLRAYPGAAPYYVCAQGQAEFHEQPAWYWNFKHAIEEERGLDWIEDLFNPGSFRVELKQGESVTFVCAAGARETAERLKTYDAVLREDTASKDQLLKGAERSAGVSLPPWIKSLVLAGDQFLVSRTRASTGSAGSEERSAASVIAGYHWFTDWSRDTMLSLSGLSLVSGRPEIAREVLLSYAQYISEGMLPNRFVDSGEAPEYNSVDGSLLYLHAAYQYWAFSKDNRTIGELFPVFQEIVKWYKRGTRYAIRADSADMLLTAGWPGVQLTWMDAKIDDWVITPRTGKPVEINALWYAALRSMEEFSRLLEKETLRREYKAEADAVQKSFQRFWYAAGGYLYDIIDAPCQHGSPASGTHLVNDSSLRPNQLFATAIPFPLLESARAKSVVDACARELFTPVGLRTLEPHHAEYRSLYRGNSRERDSAYHQGPAWPWLIGIFVASHLKSYGDPELALSFLSGFEGHLSEAGVGTVGEIFESEAPHQPGGCIAQAWSVGEILRAWALCTDGTGRFV